MATRKTTLIKRNAMKTAGPQAIKAVTRGVGAAGTMYLSKGVIADKIRPDLHGPIFFGLGILGEIFLNEGALNNVAQGMGAAGAIMTTGEVLLKNEATKFGLCPPGQAQMATQPGTPASPPMGNVNWNQLALEASQQANSNLNGVNWMEAAEEVAEEKDYFGLPERGEPETYSSSGNSTMQVGNMTEQQIAAALM